MEPSLSLACARPLHVPGGRDGAAWMPREGCQVVRRIVLLSRLGRLLSTQLRPQAGARVSSPWYGERRAQRGAEMIPASLRPNQGANGHEFAVRSPDGETGGG